MLAGEAERSIDYSPPWRHVVGVGTGAVWGVHTGRVQLAPVVSRRRSTGVEECLSALARGVPTLCRGHLLMAVSFPHRGHTGRDARRLSGAAAGFAGGTHSQRGAGGGAAGGRATIDIKWGHRGRGSTVVWQAVHSQ